MYFYATDLLKWYLISVLEHTFNQNIFHISFILFLRFALYAVVFVFFLQKFRKLHVFSMSCLSLQFKKYKIISLVERWKPDQIFCCKKSEIHLECRRRQVSKTEVKTFLYGSSFMFSGLDTNYDHLARGYLFSPRTT